MSEGGTEPTVRLATALGVLPVWRDLDGRDHALTPETAAVLLRAMAAPDNAADAADTLAEREKAEATRRLPERAVVEADRPARIALARPAAGVGWTLAVEDGEERSGTAGEAVELPALPMGLHRLELGGESCLVIAAPARAPGLAELSGRERAWGMTAAIYALHCGPGGPERGGYAELAAAAEAAGSLGASFLGVNPIHALGTASSVFGPYSPSHRGFLDPRHLSTPDAAPTDDPSGLIDHARADKALTGSLRSRFAAEVPDVAAHAELAAFRNARGPALEAFAIFETLSARHGADWRRWPAGHETPDAPAARALAESPEGAREIAFHAWLQWQADGQLAAAQAAALQSGMGLGLYTDLAVGVRPDGAEVWARPGIFARGVSLGSPPDQFSPDGQAWALAPFVPATLAAENYRPFVETIRAAMRHAGAIRIDHAVGLERTFWVPEDGTPGGYVRSDFEALAAILRIEAARAGCLIIGEDLGVVPEGLRERLDASGLYGCTVAMFEADAAGLKDPRGYRERTLASFGTHDTPTLAGWWEGNDIAWRERLGRADAATAARMRDERRRDRARLLEHLDAAGLRPDDTPREDPGANGDATPLTPASPALIAAIHALLARSGAALVAVQLDDATGTVEQANIPGTVDEHPNWRRRHTVAVDAIAGDPGVAAAARAMREAGRG